MGFSPGALVQQAVSYPGPYENGYPVDQSTMPITGNPKELERRRQAAILAGTSRVNAVFDSPDRAKQQQDFLNAIRAYYTQDANKQKGIADRKLKFSMARSGLTGGSAAVDSNRLLGEEYTKGLLDSENKAQAGYNDLRAQDEQSRLNLLSMVRSGMDTTTAASRAGAAISQNAATAQTDAMSRGLGDVFGSTANVYKDQQEAAARRRGVLDVQGSVYGAKSPWG